MKKIAKLLVAASAVALLAGCKGGKSAWTDEEKKIFEDYLFDETPIYAKNNLALALDEQNGLIVGTGSAASENDVNDYVKQLEEAGYVADDAVSEDLAEFYDLDKAVQLRKDTGYVVEQIVAVGLNKKDNNKLMLVITLTWDYFGATALYDGVGWIEFSSKFSYADLKEALDQDFEVANLIDDGTEDGVKTFVAGDFVYPEESTSWEDCGVTEYNVVWPWSTGNYYSAYFCNSVELTFAGAAAEEETAYVAALEGAGYALDEAATTQNPYDTYKKEMDAGDAYIEVTYDDQFFTDGTSALSVCFTYLIK